MASFGVVSPTGCCILDTAVNWHPVLVSAIPGRSRARRWWVPDLISMPVPEWPPLPLEVVRRTTSVTAGVEFSEYGMVT